MRDNGAPTPAAGGPGRRRRAAAASTASGGAPAAESAAHIVAISSVPTGATIALNGVDTGKVTPARWSIGGDDKARTIQLSLKGYSRSSATLTTADDLEAGSKEYSSGMAPKPGRCSSR